MIAPEFHSDPQVPEEDRERIPKGIGGACVPLHAEESIVGVMFVNVALPRELTTGEIRILNALAEIGGNAIHRTYLHEQTIKQLERLAALRSIDLAISNILDLQVTLKILINEVIRQLHVDAASVLLIQAGTGRLTYAAGQGFYTRNIEATSLRIGEGSAGIAAAERHTVEVPDLGSSNEKFGRAQLLADEHFVSHYVVH